MRFTFYSTLSIAALIANNDLVDAIEIEPKNIDEYDSYMHKHGLAEIVEMSDSAFAQVSTSNALMGKQMRVAHSFAQLAKDEPSAGGSDTDDGGDSDDSSSDSSS